MCGHQPYSDRPQMPSRDPRTGIPSHPLIAPAFCWEVLVFSSTSTGDEVEVAFLSLLFLDLQGFRRLRWLRDSILSPPGSRLSLPLNPLYFYLRKS